MVVLKHPSDDNGRPQRLLDAHGGPQGLCLHGLLVHRLRDARADVAGSVRDLVGAWVLQAALHAQGAGVALGAGRRVKVELAQCGLGGRTSGVGAVLWEVKIPHVFIGSSIWLCNINHTTCCCY